MLQRNTPLPFVQVAAGSSSRCCRLNFWTCDSWTCSFFLRRLEGGNIVVRAALAWEKINSRPFLEFFCNVEEWLACSQFDGLERCGCNFQWFEGQKWSFNLDKLSCKMDVASEWHITTLLFSENILRINHSIISLLRSSFPARIRTILNQTLICMAPARLKRRTVARSCIGSFIAICNFGFDWFLSFADHSLRRKVLLTIWRPAPVWRRHMCGSID